MPSTREPQEKRPMEEVGRGQGVGQNVVSDSSSWQDEFRALFPTVNISFGGEPRCKKQDTHVPVHTSVIIGILIPETQNTQPTVVNKIQLYPIHPIENSLKKQKPCTKV